MFNKEMLQGLIHERLSEAAGEIFSLFEQAVAEYQREIDRLKNVSEAKRVVVDFRDPQATLGGAQETQTEIQESENSMGSFNCKEEAELVVIKEEDEPQMQITTRDELQPRGQQQKANSEVVSGEAETEKSFESEEEGSDMSNVESDAAKKPFSYSVRNKAFPKIKIQMKRTLKDKRRVTTLESNQTFNHVIPEMESPGHSQQPCGSPDIARPFSCTICQRRFKLKITQEAHMRAHAGGNPCSCAECGITFKKQSYLINHVYRVHTTTNEKPIQCTLCSKGFVHANAFKVHMDSHTGERPFRCALCGKGFTQKGTLKRHMVTHTGEKPYNCSVCGKDYSTKQNLTNHMAKNH